MRHSPLLSLLIPMLACTSGSEQALNGIDGSAGTSGQSCWDLDGDGEADASEDVNGDGIVDVQDCQGQPGQDGQDCWDLNGNGEPDPVEDINGDGSINVEDCQDFQAEDTGDAGDNESARG